MSMFTFLMARHEGLNRCDTAAILRLSFVLSKVPESYNEAFKRFREAVSEWVKTTEAGKEAWEESSGDLNIGDMMSYGYFSERSLTMILLNHGITVEAAHQLIFDQQREYDTVLAFGDVKCSYCDELMDITECVALNGKWNCGCEEEAKP